jgi:hypothetical protein
MPRKPHSRKRNASTRVGTRGRRTASHAMISTAAVAKRAAASCSGVRPCRPIRMNGKADAHETIVKATAPAAISGCRAGRDDGVESVFMRQ